MADDPPAQSGLFGDALSPVPAVRPAAPSTRLQDLAAALAERFGDRLYLGTSSWHFPGWLGLVWQGRHVESDLSRHGLPAFAAHPLLRTVSLDRAFYRPLDAATYAGLAAQVPPGFRWVVKAPALITDAVRRDPATARPMADNPVFLDPQAALDLCLAPAVDGLMATGPLAGDPQAHGLGALVFQLSPLPERWRLDEAALHARLAAMFERLRPRLPAGARLALELRDAELLTPALAALLRTLGVRPVLGLHDRMPDVAGQLPLQRACWPGDLVCRWNLQRGHRYADARDLWAPFNRLAAPDEATRDALARVIAGVLGAGQRAFVTINNKAEGSAPLSVVALAEAVLRRARNAG